MNIYRTIRNYRKMISFQKRIYGGVPTILPICQPLNISDYQNWYQIKVKT